MSNVNFRVDDVLKKKSYSVLKELGITSSELFKSVLQYVADTGKLPVKHIVVSEEDLKLLSMMRERIHEVEESLE